MRRSTDAGRGVRSTAFALALASALAGAVSAAVAGAPSMDTGAAASGAGLTAVDPASPPAPALAELMQRLAARPHAHASFLERQYFAVLDRPLESSGELFYDAPDRLEKRTLTPKPESLILDHGRLEILRGRRSYSLALRAAPQIAPLVDSLRALLAGALPELEQAYRLRFGVDGSQWTLELVPREARLAALIARIRIVGSADLLQTVEIRRTDGDRSLMTVRDLPER